MNHPDPVDRLLADRPPLMTLGETAEVLRMSVDGYKTAVLAGRAPGNRYDAGGWRVFRDELADYLRGQWRREDHTQGDDND